MTAFETLIQSVIQALPADLTGGLQHAVRVLAITASPKIVTKAEVATLTNTPMNLESDFVGPWQCNVIAATFTKDDGTGLQISNTDPKDVGFYLVLGEKDFPLIELKGWTGTGLCLTDHIRIGSGDQVRVKATGGGTATTEIRGELL